MKIAYIYTTLQNNSHKIHICGQHCGHRNKYGKKKNRLTTCKWLVKAVFDGRGDRT